MSKSKVGSLDPTAEASKSSTSTHNPQMSVSALAEEWSSGNIGKQSRKKSLLASRLREPIKCQGIASEFSERRTALNHLAANRSDAPNEILRVADAALVRDGWILMAKKPQRKVF